MSDESTPAGTAPVASGARIWMNPPCPPAEESYAKCLEAGFVIRTLEGGYRALMRGRRNPLDHGIIGRP